MAIDFDVVVLGGVGVDTIVRVPDLAVPAGDFLPVPPVYDYVAHSGNGVALGFHALGLRTKFADFLGDDPAGDLVRARYAAVGLDFSALPAPNGTPRSVNLVDAAGRRFSFFDGRHPDGLVLPPEFYLPFVERAGHVHVASPRALEAFPAARRLGTTSSTDIHAWDGADPWAHPLAYEADLVFLSSAAAPDRIDAIMHQIADKGRATVVVATEGAAGSRVLCRGDEVPRRFPVVAPDRPVVDSNGAGDAYSTAFTSRWLAGRPIEECALAGAVSGAFACGAAGTHEELISGAALDEAVARLKA
ncbi:carbohydrate kinase family protein [Dactylosporangium sp. AC04546]|uniref:carbohydrate kinase family protein n=1 Tax=Dactylosporangium sp. AC04546 TaxID=2862460 RepID=UPI001EE1322A|nr:carbohydrate kinase family protein [Dactylosporangium sp. AC04546]WVK87555.1 carbohydrate kinase family protein [Dactylosporangium sp. AC04546]